MQLPRLDWECHLMEQAVWPHSLLPHAAPRTWLGEAGSPAWWNCANSAPLPSTLAESWELMKWQGAGPGYWLHWEGLSLVVHGFGWIPGAEYGLQGGARDGAPPAWPHSLPPCATPWSWLEPCATRGLYLLQAMSTPRALHLLLLLPLAVAAPWGKRHMEGSPTHIPTPYYTHTHTHTLPHTTHTHTTTTTHTFLHSHSTHNIQE